MGKLFFAAPLRDKGTQVAFFHYSQIDKNKLILIIIHIFRRRDIELFFKSPAKGVWQIKPYFIGDFRNR
ncbi:MAG: hypothetical protein DHS20C18_56060 [Saprospiraceae bacterium]|nr:MAG: hypothetical protein DHS20C18_56060 [Saprospiraceae bacterium]